MSAVNDALHDTLGHNDPSAMISESGQSKFKSTLSLAKLVECVLQVHVIGCSQICLEFGT